MSDVYRFLLTPRWLVLLVMAALSVPGCVLLAGWQLDRLGGAERENNRIERNSSASPVPPGELLAVGAAVSQELEWRSVTASGRYDTARQLFVRNRPRDGRQGFHVLTPLVPETGPAVLVNRGWVSAALGSGSPETLQTPSTPVRVTGYLRPSEGPRGSGAGSDLPAGQVLSIDAPRIASGLPYETLPGYLSLDIQSPPPPVVAGVAVPNPLEVPGSSSELLHRSYAWQWYVFAAIGPVGVALLARREAADRARGSAPGRQPRQHV